MPKPLESYVKKILAKNDRDQKLQAAIQHGWKARKSYPANGRWRRKTTRAHVVWEETVDRAVELLMDDPGVKVLHHHDTVSFIFDDGVLLRFKKAGLTLKSSNIQTVLAELFHDHEMDLFGYAGLQRVEACYVLNNFETEIIWAGIIARDKGDLLWHFELATEPMETSILPFPKLTKGSTADLAKPKTGKPDKQDGKEDMDSGE